jgi:hypothetical protein
MRARRLAFVLALLALAGARPARAEDEKPDPIDATRGYVGYAPGLVQAMTEESRKEVGITRTTGIFVDRVVPASPAQKAGLEPHDVILKINGVDIDVSKIDRDDRDAYQKWQKEVFKPITSKIKPGDKVEMVVERKGKTLTITPVAMPKTEYDFLTSVAADDENFGVLPDPDRAGPPNAAALDFENVPEGQLRPAEIYAVGIWQAAEDDTGKNHVLRQDESIPSAPRLQAIVTGSGRSYADGTITCRTRLMGGELSVSAGILFRVRTRTDGYAAIADGVAKTFAIVAYEKGKPRVVASVPLGSPKLKEWHTFTLTFVGKKIEAVFDGTLKVAGEDAAFTSGWAGMTCEKDALTDFDDWKAIPAGK